MTSIFLKMEDDLKFLEEDNLNYSKMEDDLQEIIQPIQVKTIKFLKMKDGLKNNTTKSSKNKSIFENGRQPLYLK